MSEEKPKRLGICTYCGADGPVTEDHVPPWSLFPAGTEGRIAVDACKECNEGAKKDDELFIHVVSLSHDPALVPGDQTIERVRRKIEERRPALVLHTRRDTIRKLRVKTSEGAREAVASFSTEEDKERLRRVLGRYARGIYFHETRSRIPPEERLDVAKLPQPRISSKVEIEKYAKALGPVLEIVDTLEPKQVGAPVFEYRLLVEGNVMILYMKFFDANEFIVLRGFGLDVSEDQAEAPQDA